MKVKKEKLGAIRHSPRGDVDVIHIEHPLDVVRLTTKELQAVCPVTGQPDIYECVIEYEPKGAVIETKSLKFYLWQFRDVGIFAEDLADRIASDLFQAVSPAWIRVSLTQNVRGGIVLHVERTIVEGKP